MLRMTLFLLMIASTTLACKKEKDPISNDVNQSSADRMLLVLSAPSVNNTYYAAHFQQIIDFHVAYANAIMNNDNVVVLADAATMPHLRGRLPEEVLLTESVSDIWMRDFTTVNPMAPVEFTYTWASMSRRESERVQNSWKGMADRNGIQRTPTDYILDGGNLVDNYAGSVITTTRFLTDNNLTMEEGKQALRELLGATNVAILPPDDEVLAHSDGMVSWLDANTLLVNDYSDDPSLRTQILNELNNSFPGAKIVELPVVYANNGIDPSISSACGININATMTLNNVYVPTFDMSHDQAALDVIRANTTKKVIPVPASGVCGFGGSVRCLTWQLAGANADRLMEAARKN